MFLCELILPLLPWLKRQKNTKPRKSKFLIELLKESINCCITIQISWKSRSAYIPFKVTISISFTKWKFVIVWINIASTHWIKKTKQNKTKQKLHSLLNCWKRTFYSITVQISWWSPSTYILFKLTLSINKNKWKCVIVWINIASISWIKKTTKQTKQKQKQENLHSLLRVAIAKEFCQAMTTCKYCLSK